MVLKPAKQNQISFGYCDVQTGQRVYPPLPLSVEATEGEEHSKHSDVQHTSSYNTTMNITSWPPLAQATVISRKQNSVQFTVLLESASSLTASTIKRPEVVLWHSHNGEHDWCELPLEPADPGRDQFLVRALSDRVSHQQWYTASLSGTPKHQHLVKFTLKYRVGTDHEWRWANDVCGIADGELCYQSHDFAKHSSYSLDHWFAGVSQDIKVESETPETANTLLYSLTCPIPAATGEDSSYEHHQLGLPLQSARFFSLVRLWAPWLAPRQGRGLLRLDKDAILISFLRADGTHVVVLGISGIDDVVTTFSNDEHGNVIIKGRSDNPSVANSRVLVAVSDSFEIANAAVMYHARKLVTSYTTGYTTDIAILAGAIKPDWMEEWYDGFTYCTWNGLGQDLTAQKIYDALEDLSKENINITNLIIDDNWQSLSKGATQFVRGWSSFEANLTGFPDGMKATTTEIRRRHPSVNHIAVWHALLGYWGGIDPDGEIAQNYKTIEVKKQPGVAGGTFTVVHAEDAKRMYDDFYSFLQSVGIDSVKTDAQFFLDLLVHAPDRRALIKEYQDAWTIAHLRHFSSRAISCMSQSPQFLFHSQLPTNKPRLLVRNSDDFFPNVEASHPWHIFCNAHNALFMQHLNALPDWDMFQTSHPWAGFHAAARCVSGGPIYFTDFPGKHDIPLIHQMTAQTPKGRTIILRPPIVGKSMDPYNSYSAQALLKVGTYVGFARTGTGILGLFNVSGQPLSELITLSSFPGTEEGEYVIGSFTSGQVSIPMSRTQSTPMVGIKLEEAGWDILTAYAVRNFTLPRKPESIQVAMMGLIGKMTGSAAVTGCDMYVESNGRLRIWTSLKALGVVGIYMSDLPDRTVEDDFMIVIFGNPIGKSCVKKNNVCHEVLEIDIARAWEESGEDVGWGNEVTFEVFAR